MRTIGWLALFAGGIWLIVALNMNVTVSTGYGNYVNNLGLMASQQNHIIIGAFISLGGLLMLIFGRQKSVASDENVKCPYCAEYISREAIKCKHCSSDIDKSLIKPMLVDISDLTVTSSVNGTEQIDDFKVKVLAGKIRANAYQKPVEQLLYEYKPQLNDLTENFPDKLKSELKQRLTYWLS